MIPDSLAIQSSSGPSVIDRSDDSEEATCLSGELGIKLPERLQQVSRISTQTRYSSLSVGSDRHVIQREEL